MVSTARIFFAGVGTTFGILAIGFGGGVLMANSTLHDEVAQKRNVSEPPPGIRVIQPASAQPALIAAAAPVEAPAPETTPEQRALPQVIPNRIQTREKDQQAERAEQRKVEAVERERRKRSAWRKSRRDAARAKQQQEQQQKGQPQQPGILAFGGDGPPRVFGN
jgi:outer membrane biosynthesis protein TonB